MGLACTKVGPGCDHCYAERENDFRKWGAWLGSGTARAAAPRRRTGQKVIGWNRRPSKLIGAEALFSVGPRVFLRQPGGTCSTTKCRNEWRTDLWALIHQCQKPRIPGLVTKADRQCRPRLLAG